MSEEIILAIEFRLDYLRIANIQNSLNRLSIFLLNRRVL